MRYRFLRAALPLNSARALAVRPLRLPIVLEHQRVITVALGLLEHRTQRVRSAASLLDIAHSDMTLKHVAPG